MLYLYRWTLLCVVLFANTAFSQLLPRGIGSFFYGTRQYSGDTGYYDENGHATSLDSKFDTNFNAEALESGKLALISSVVMTTLRNLIPLPEVKTDPSQTT